SRWFGKRGNSEIDFAAVARVVCEIVGPRLIVNRPATFRSGIGADSSDDSGICRSWSNAEIEDVDFLERLKRDRAAHADGERGMRAGCAERELNDRAGAHRHASAHGQ